MNHISNVEVHLKTRSGNVNIQSCQDVFLGSISTKQKRKCLTQGNTTVPPFKLEPFNLKSSTLPLCNCTTSNWNGIGILV